MASLGLHISAGKRCFNTYRQLLHNRHTLLTTIYKPAFEELERASPEYEALARSGKVWENYFKPQNLQPYLAAQSKLKETLMNVDKQKDFLHERQDFLKMITRALVNEYAHQSTAMEGNQLLLGDSVIIGDELNRKFFNDIDNLTSISTSALASLPSANALLSHGDEDQVVEMRNHIVVSRYLTELGLANHGTSGISLSDIKSLSRTMLAGTNAERSYALQWGRRIRPGEFRATPITVKSNRERIFPYPAEVPACMERFIKWRDQTHHLRQLHPVILATHIYVYFCHIHPFPDGNGRVGRCLMADYMIRQGYLPVVFVDMDRKDSLQMVSDAQDGKPEELCMNVAQTQAEMLFTLSLR